MNIEIPIMDKKVFKPINYDQVRFLHSDQVRSKVYETNNHMLMLNECPYWTV